MTLKDQIRYCKHQIATAHKETVTFRAIKDSLEFLSSLVPGYEKDGGLYQKCITEYDLFLKRTIGTGVNMSPSEGKAMKDIIKYLYANSKLQTESGVFDSWCYILTNWDKQNEFIGKQKKLTQIYKNLLEILDNLKNGNTKATQTRNDQEKQSLRDAIRERQSRRS